MDSAKIRTISLLGALGVFAVAALVFLLKPGFLQSAFAAKDMILEQCRSRPSALFVALVVLPAFGFPVSALLLLAGAVWGSNWKSVSICMLAMFLNMTWTYLVSIGPARQLISRLLGGRWVRWKDIERHDLFKLTILLRVTPGVPLFLQNYVLGLLAVPYIPYILLSIPLNGIFVIGFVLTGGALFEGQAGIALVGVLILIAAAILVRWIRNWIQLKGPQHS